MNEQSAGKRRQQSLLMGAFYKSLNASICNSVSTERPSSESIIKDKFSSSFLETANNEFDRRVECSKGECVDFVFKQNDGLLLLGVKFAFRSKRGKKLGSERMDAISGVFSQCLVGVICFVDLTSEKSYLEYYDQGKPLFRENLSFQEIKECAEYSDD